MSKARILADTIADGAELADGAIAVAEVTGAAPLASPDFTGTLSLAGVDLTPTFTQLNHVAGVSSAIQTQINTKSPIAGPTFTGTATADILNVDEASFLAIAKDISDTAVDVFVYDTSKDSDGGAWRKRTQHTSWYNEAASSTRSSRKEFPSVAVIVAESNNVTIYDGDDPDLPMWMVFTGSGGPRAVRQGVSSVSAFNGVFLNGRSGSERALGYVSFIHDDFYQFSTGGLTRFNQTGLVNRNTDGSGYTVTDSSMAIVNNTVNDVAMTVLDNAPIDAATGLPVPTIAVATAANVSIIRDNGTVVDITYANYNNSQNIYFNRKNHLVYSQNNVATQRMVKVYYDIPSSDLTNSQGGYQRGAETVAYADSGVSFDVILHPTTVGINDLSENSIGTSVKLILTDETTPPTSTMLNFIASDYQTGWMNGAIKLATLSDTDTANVTGAELVTNGTFASNTTGWAGTATLSIDSNRLKVLGGYASQTLTTVVGRCYVITYTITNGNDAGGVYLGTGTGGADAYYYFSTGKQGTGTYARTFIATTTSTYLRLYAWDGGTDFAFYDNVSLRIAEKDRSVNGNGLEVYGTVTKTVVATGADLVAYSGFSSSNYLQQPYNAGLAYGAGDFCYTVWAKKTGNSAGYIFDRSNGDGTQRVTVYFGNGTSINGYTNNGVINSVVVPNGSWFQVVLLRTSGTMKIYINGILKGSVVTTTNLSGDTNVPLRIGTRFNSTDVLADGSLSLFRSSATAPSEEQITKIYNDEKFLFQTGAQATLHGSSNAVTALAYDDTTDLLHVGTSAGRSVFQGLCRVENTTTAVGAAISASNSLVAEE